ncbi:nuclear transport factor 2 family protein [Streptomyces sp. NPDC002577]
MDDLEAIRQLKARYFRLLDTQEWDAFRDVFAPDLHIEVEHDPPFVFDERDAYLTALQPILAGVRTCHHGHTPEITLTSPDRATGVWAMEDHVWYPNGATLHGYGHYHETYAKGGDGAWRIVSLRLTRLWVDQTHPTAG